MLHAPVTFSNNCVARRKNAGDKNSSDVPKFAASMHDITGKHLQRSQAIKSINSALFLTVTRENIHLSEDVVNHRYILQPPVTEPLKHVT